MSEEWMKAAVWRVSVEDYGNRSGQATISGPGVYCMQVPVSYSMLDFMQALAAAPAQPAGQEQHPDDEAVDRFAVAMKAKLAKSREKGRHGWQTASAAHLSGLLYRHMYKADPLDVANLAMMLHQNGQAIELPQEARHDQGEVQRLRKALPYLRNAVAEASASGVAQLAVVSTKPDGSGKLVCKFECVEFMADLAAVVGAGPQTEDDDARAEARKFLQRNGIASTGQEVEK